jgi:hypothetical protein
MAQGKIERASSGEQVTKFISDNKDSLRAILFVNETVESVGLFGNFFKLFLPDSSDNDLEKKIAAQLTLMKVDVSNEKLKSLMPGNGVTSVPCLVVYSADGKISY